MNKKLSPIWLVVIMGLIAFAPVLFKGGSEALSTDQAKELDEALAQAGYSVRYGSAASSKIPGRANGIALIDHSSTPSDVATSKAVAKIVSSYLQSKGIKGLTFICFIGSVAPGSASQIHEADGNIFYLDESP